MPQDLTVNARLVIPSRELQWRFSRASGPGGQGLTLRALRLNWSLLYVFTFGAD